MKGIFAKISSLFGGRAFSSTPKVRSDRSFFSFQHTGHVLRAEEILRQNGLEVEVMGPPPAMRTGCDMVLVCAAVLEPKIIRLLAQANIHPEEVRPVSSELLEPVSLFQVKDLGQWFMVRAANMKITVAKEQGIIVNVSGGGCPDVPYLADLLLGQSIATSAEPRLSGQTLCSYALQKAFVEARRLWLKNPG